MKHYQKAVEILGEGFFQRSHTLSKHALNSLHDFIDEMIEAKEPAETIVQQANEFMAMDLARMSSELISIKQSQISEGIEWLRKYGRWTDLGQISKHATKAAKECSAEDEIGSMGKRMSKHYEVQLSALGASISEYKKVIDQMKQRMLDDGIMHWLKVVQDKPDSEHASSWKDSAKELIIDLLDMDDKVELFFDDHGAKLGIYKDGGQYGKVGTIKHWTVVYSDPAPEYGENSFFTYQSEYFHLDKKEQAVECLIDRYLSGEAHKAFKGSGSQSLEVIKATSEINVKIG